MCFYIRSRFNEERVRPNKIELKMLEVLKKIVESGWIISIIEIKQILIFLEIYPWMIEGKANI